MRNNLSIVIFLCIIIYFERNQPPTSKPQFQIDSDNSATMKILSSAALWTILSTSVGAFAPSPNVATTHYSSSLSATAVSREEDLMLTLKVILDHADRSSTVSKEQFIQQVEESVKEDAPVETIDISIPYDATVQLAYDASDKSMSFDEFKPVYLAQAVADVVAKQPFDISIPYDATVQLAYDASDKSMSFADFKPIYLAQAVADVVAKQPFDISIPYDATVQLAYDASDKSMSFADFKPKYLAQAVADVVAKKNE